MELNVSEKKGGDGGAISPIRKVSQPSILMITGNIAWIGFMQVCGLQEGNKQKRQSQLNHASLFVPSTNLICMLQGSGKFQNPKGL
jgi:hypothetical protein